MNSQEMDVSLMINDNDSNDPKISCLAFIRGTPKQLTTKLCFDGINQYLIDHKFESRCISVFIQKQGEKTDNQLGTITDVQEMINKIKQSIDPSYFNIPNSLQLEQYRVIDQVKVQKQNEENLQEEVGIQNDEFLRNFITTQTDEINKQQEMEEFQKYESFLNELLEDRLISQSDQQESINNGQLKIIIYGPRSELIAIENTQITYLNSNYFYLKTLSLEKKELQIDNVYKDLAKEQYDKQISYMKLDYIHLGIIDSSVEQSKHFYKLFEINQKTNYILSMSIFMTNEDKESLVVPPRYYIRNNSASAQENLDSKKNAWVRVDNFYALHLGKLGNELQRIEFTNNTVLAFKFQNCDKVYLREFQKLLEKKFTPCFDPHKQECINTRTKEEFQTYHGNNLNKCWYKLLKEYGFNLSYSILTLISHNKLSVFMLTKFLQKIDNLINNGYSEYIIDKTIEYLYNKKSDINRYKMIDSFLETFSSVSQQEKQLIILEESTKKNIKIVASRRVSITPSGLIYNLKELEMSNRVMRIFSDSTDQFIRGIFQDDSLENAKHMRYVSRYFRKMLQSFTVLNRTYINFGWSASQLRACSSWFFSESETLKKADVILRIGDFSKINPPAKKSARIGQCFSSSIPFRFKKQPIIEFIDDISTEGIIIEKDKYGNCKYFTKKPKVFTDGIGTISQDLAKEISDHLGAFFMSAIQVRYGGAKGVLCVNHKSNRKNLIQLRGSMLKYQITDQEDQLTLDILERNKYRYGYLNRQVIILLRSLGIEEEHFLKAQNEYIKELNKSALKDANIFTLFNNDYSKDGTRLWPITHLLRQMQTCQINMEDDLFCQGVIHTLKKRGFYILRKKSNIYLKQSARLMGVIDEYGVLEPNEIFAYISQDNENTFFQIEGDVIVVKNPCLHPGDIRKLKAVNLDTIQSRLGEGVYNPFKKLRNILIFPQKGSEPVTAQIAGSDLDGDCYFISWDKRFIPENQRDPFNYDEDESSQKQITEEEFQKLKQAENKKEISFHTLDPVREDIEDDKMLDFFIDFINNENLGKIDNAHLVYADKSDKFAEDPICIQLATLHAKAVDYAKTGVSPTVPKKFQIKDFPDFMEKDDKNSYESSSILGKLYRDVKEQYEKNCKNNLAVNKEITFIDENLLFNPMNFDDYIIKNVQNEGEQNEHRTYLQEEIDYAIIANNLWNIEINNLKNFFGAQDEFEIYTGNFSKLIKVERKKKMSAEIVQQRIISTLVSIKNRFELMFFKTFDEDKDRFYDETNKRKNYSKRCKIRATIWYTICLLRIPQHVVTEALKYNKEGSLMNQVFKYLQEEKYLGYSSNQNVRGNNHNKFYNHINTYVGLPWFIIGEILLEIKKDNDNMKQQELLRSLREQQNENNNEIRNGQQENHVQINQSMYADGYESDEYL